MTLEADFKKVLEANLPQAASQVVVERLTRIDELEKQVKNLSAIIERQATDLKAAGDVALKADALSKRRAELDMQQANIERREREMRVFEAELKAKESERRADEMHSLVEVVFKSPIWRRKVDTSEFTGADYNGGNTTRYRTGGTVSEEVRSE